MKHSTLSEHRTHALKLLPTGEAQQRAAEASPPQLSVPGSLPGRPTSFQMANHHPPPHPGQLLASLAPYGKAEHHGLPANPYGQLDFSVSVTGALRGPL